MRPKASARGGNVLRRARRVAAGIVFCVATLGFLFPALWAEKPIRVLAAWQFAPSALRIAQGSILATGAMGLVLLVSFLVLFVASALLGRWYCAFLCPLGFLQDLAALFRRKRRGFVKSSSVLRVLTFACFVTLGVGGALGLASWFEPWSMTGRFFAYNAQPLARLFFRSDSPVLPWFLIAVSGLAIALVIVAAGNRGRWFCNNLCPIGSVLGFLNRSAPFRLRLDTESCSACGRCSSVCLADCLDGKRKYLDSSRCVYCLECVNACPSTAFRYGVPLDRKEIGQDNKIFWIHRTVTRSDFLGKGLRVAGGAAVGAFLGAGAVALAQKAMGKGRFDPAEAGGPATFNLVSPPGSLSTRRFAETCTACGLCVSRCPSKILRPSTGQFGLTGLFAPRLDYDVSYCQFSCTTCLDLCPSGALVKMSPKEKQRTKIGNAALVRDLCIVIKNGTKCGACAEHCPTGAVHMVQGMSALPEPVFSTSICIGCGACHHACPVKPQKAITVSGLPIHEIAEIPSDRLFDLPALPASPNDTGLFPF